jgi:GNAT superfamily N-acetyltransferase
VSVHEWGAPERMKLEAVSGFRVTKPRLLSFLADLSGAPRDAVRQPSGRRGPAFFIAMDADSLRIRQMEGRDIEVGMRLKETAGWNQIRADWEAFLSLEPAGCLVAEQAGRVVATATAIGYGRSVGWIGMILVDPDFRRRGIATRMMERAIAFLDALPCACLKLDATEAGAPVYERMGFQVEYGVERWRRPPGPIPEPESGATEISRVRSIDVPRLGAWDEPVFGADRTRLLDWYRRNGGPGFRLEEDETTRGLVFSRPGSFAFQVGPLVAEDESSARRLLLRALSASEDRPVIIDLPTPNSAAVELAGEFGFERSRVLLRMHRGPNRHPGRPDKVFALAGFEYG